MQIKIFQNRLILKSKFTISHGAYDHREQLLVQLSENNASGFGETIAIDYYGQDIEKMRTSAEKAALQLSTFSTERSPRTFYEHLLKVLPDDPFLRSAFDTAFIDLHELLHPALSEPETPAVVPSSITIGLSDSIESVEEKLGQRWPFFKIKMNQENFREEVISLVAKSGRSFGVDANGAFDDLGQAQKAISLLHTNGCQYIEQLLDKSMAHRIGELDRPKGSKFLLDESICTIEDARKYVTQYDGYVLKLTKCGGLTPVMDIIGYAREQGKLLLAGCMTESSIGINHMLSILHNFDYADLDGAYLISNDSSITSSIDRELKSLSDDGFFY